jgi:hypothetical protein
MSMCERCKEREAMMILTRENGEDRMCLPCYNRWMEDELDFELEYVPEVFTVMDWSGKSREFSVSRRLDPLGIFLEAFEGKEDGYRFAVHGELNGDQEEMYYELVAKTKRGVTTSYIKASHFPTGEKVDTLRGDELTGRLLYDSTSSGEPMVVIDGKPYSWEQVGQMMRSFEGFQIQMKIFDMTDDVE